MGNTRFCSLAYYWGGAIISAGFEDGYMTGKAVTLQMKRAYVARVRRANYEASLRLEGFPADPDAATKPLPTRADVIQHYRKQVRS